MNLWNRLFVVRIKEYHNEKLRLFKRKFAVF